MAEKPRSLSEEDLHELVDGRLDPERRAEVEQALADDAESAAKVAHYRAQAEALRELTEPILQEPVPDRLLRVARRSKRARTMQFARIAAAVALLVAGAAAGWFGRGYITVEDDLLGPMIHEAVLAHKLVMARSQVGERLVVAEGADNLSEDAIPIGLQTPIRAPTLRKSDLLPVSITSSAGAAGNAITITYVDLAEHPVTLYIRQTRSAVDIPIGSATEEGMPALYWLDGPLLYVVVGEGESDQLLRIAEEIYRAPAIGGMRPARPVSE